MSDVFISYAREDREKAQLLAHAFEEQKWLVWWDKVIPPGRKYADVIGEELASAKAVIVLWSQASVASDWVKDEATEGSNRRVLIPVLVEKVSPPYGFRQLQTADLSEWDGSSSDAELQGLVRGIGSLINKPVTAPTVSSEPSDSKKRRQLLFLLAGGVLVLILGFIAFKFIFSRDGNQNQNQRAQIGNQSQSPGTLCDSDSRQKAARLTSDGLMMIDPGANYNAATLQFREAITICPDYADAYFWRGQSYVALQQNRNAVADFRKVVEITNDEDTREKAQKFIAEIEAPRTTPSPVIANGNANNANTHTNTNTNTNTGTNTNTTTNTSANANTNTNNSGSNTNANTAASNTNQNSGPGQSQVNDLFDADKSKRIAATTRLIIEKKHDSKTVGMSVAWALRQPDNKSGVINTLVFLESVDPEILKQHRRPIEKLMAVAKDNGDQTVEHIKKVERLLNQ